MARMTPISRLRSTTLMDIVPISPRLPTRAARMAMISIRPVMTWNWARLLWRTWLAETKLEGSARYSAKVARRSRISSSWLDGSCCVGRDHDQGAPVDAGGLLGQGVKGHKAILLVVVHVDHDAHHGPERFLAADGKGQVVAHPNPLIQGDTLVEQQGVLIAGDQGAPLGETAPL